MTAMVSTGAVVGGLVGLALGPFVATWVLSAPESGRWWWPGGSHIPPSTRLRVLVAVIAAALGALAGSVGLGAGWFGLVLSAVVAAPLVVIDVRIHRLPDRLVLPLGLAELLVVGVVTAVTGDATAGLRAVIAAAATAVVLGGLSLLVPRAFGMGDAKLASVLSLPVGWVSGRAVVLGFVAAIVLGAVVAEVLILSRRARWKSAVAFGPALIIGYLGAAAVVT